jgi:hypothetical protein
MAAGAGRIQPALRTLADLRRAVNMDTDQGPRDLGPDYHPGADDDPREPDCDPIENAGRIARALKRSRAPRPMPAVLMPEVHETTDENGEEDFDGGEGN